MVTKGFMNNTSLIEDNIQYHPSMQKLRLAFHAAGYATAIYFNNKMRGLPPVFFQIVLPGTGEHPNIGMPNRALSHDEIGLEGGRLIEFLPLSIHDMVTMPENSDHLVTEYIGVIEADIMNLLTGPIAEAKHVAITDAEVISQQLVNLEALGNYGGGPKLVLINEYLQSFSPDKQEQRKKLDMLFIAAYNFVTNQANWAAITRLAHYVTCSHKRIVSHQEITALLGH